MEIKSRFIMKNLQRSLKLETEVRQTIICVKFRRPRDIGNDFWHKGYFVTKT